MKIAINGFGRIGRATFKALLEKYPEIEIAAINDLTDSGTLAHLLKFDTVYGVYGEDVKANENKIIVGEKEFPLYSEKNPEMLPWKDLGIDVVLECTGFFTKYEDAKKHLDAGAKKVIISAPSKSKEVNTYALGANQDKYDPNKDDVVSMASCTTNCLVLVAKILNDNFGIKKAFMTTVHSYTSSQNLVDGPHKDLRRARAAAANMVLTTTGAAIAATKVLPELEGKIDGLAVRVPTICSSLLDLVCELEKNVTIEEINKIFEEYSEQENYKGILGVEKRPLVSSDYIGNSHSAVVDLSSTMVEKDNMAKIMAWYDNEWGYSCRLAEFAKYVGKKL